MLSTSRTNPISDETLQIIYDGECPFCSQFVTLYRIREHIKRVELIDARTVNPAVSEAMALGFNLNDGMVVKLQGRFYYGADAMNVLAMLGSSGTVFNRLNRVLFRRPRLARLLYPALVRGRKLTLRLLGRKLIGEA